MNPYSSTLVDENLDSSNQTQQPQPVVDLNKYPDPVDSTKKIRGKSELLENLIGGLEPELLIAKGFYFFFFAAFGSLFPLMGVYFKQLGLNGAQAGILTGIRPLVEGVSASSWVRFAEKRGKAKLLLILSLCSWILFTFPLGSIQPEPVACLSSNKSHLEIKDPEGPNALYVRKRRDVINEQMVLIENGHNENNLILDLEENLIDQEIDTDGQNGNTKILHRVRRKIPKLPKGMTPYKLDELYIGYEPEKMKGWVSPTYSNLVFKKDDVNKVFVLLFVLVIIGECLSSPAILLADGCVLNFLGEQAGERYGHQRMFGSLGWAIAMFFVGIALDQSKFPTSKCKIYQEKNYTVCFAIFVILMGFAIILAWRLQIPENTTLNYNNSNLEMEIQQQQQQENLQSQSRTSHPEISTETGIPHTTVWSQRVRKLPEWVTVVKHFKTTNCIAFLLVAWLMGIGIGLIFTFLFWHLQEFGGSPTLFGIASVINHISEIFAYFFSSTFISQLGHVKVLCLGLLCNVLRFLYISVLSNPWWVLPFEFVQGLTHAAVWAACCSYLAHNTPPELRPGAQSLLHLIHHGFGRGFGAIVGGLLVSGYGTVTTFRLYGFLCTITLGIFGFLNFYRKDSGFIRELPQDEDPHSLAEETSHLAPHGVPGGGGGGLQRVSSNIRLEEQGQQSTGFNPFNNDPSNNQSQQQQQYFNR